MKRTITAIALMAASIACAVPAPYPVTVNSRAQTAPPVVAYAGNETVYRVSFTDGDTASAIVAGEVPFFAWATNNSASVNSTSTYAIVAGTTGVVDFTFSPAAVNFAPGRYIYETGVKGSNGNNRVYRQGTFQIYGSPVGSGVAAVNWTTNMNWAAINWQNLPTWLSTPAVTPAQTSGWVTASHDGFITTNDADRIVFNALSTNRVTRWYDPELSTRWAEWDGGTNIVIYKATVSGTNFVVNLSANFEETLTHTKPSWVNEPFPVEGSLSYWTCVFDTLNSFFIVSSPEFEGPVVAFWVSETYGAESDISYPITLNPFDAYAQGTATVAIASFNLTTNVEYRYFLPTNAIPPELANLDNLQGWLNNLYAMKSVVDGHITDGTHTNVTLAGTVTIGGVTRTDWPAGTPGAVTNGQAGPITLAGTVMRNIGGYGLKTTTTDGRYMYHSRSDGPYAILRVDSGANGLVVANDQSSGGLRDLNFYAGGNIDEDHSLTVDMSGYVGIGTYAPAKKLDVAGEANFRDGVYIGAHASIFDSGSNCYWRVTASNGTFYASDTNGVRQFKFVTEAP